MLYDLGALAKDSEITTIGISHFDVTQTILKQSSHVCLKYKQTMKISLRFYTWANFIYSISREQYRHSHKSCRQESKTSTTLPRQKQQNAPTRNREQSIKCSESVCFDVKCTNFT